MKLTFSIFIKLLLILELSVLCFSQEETQEDFDFFYFVQQWPGSYCDTKHSCCYPKTGKPAADFSIHGLWPNYKDGGYPSNCNPDHVLDKSEDHYLQFLTIIGSGFVVGSYLVSRLEKEWPSLTCPSSDGYKFWSHEWVKHGTCAESQLDQREYFETALKLKEKVNLLQILNNAGIKPDDKFYDLEEIEEAIKEGTGYSAGIECNKDQSKNSQLYQIYLCVDTSGSDIIECPVRPRGSCASKVQFAKF